MYWFSSSFLEFHWFLHLRKDFSAVMVFEDGVGPPSSKKYNVLSKIVRYAPPPVRVWITSPLWEVYYIEGEEVRTPYKCHRLYRWPLTPRVKCRSHPPPLWGELQQGGETYNWEVHIYVTSRKKPQKSIFFSDHLGLPTRFQTDFPDITGEF